MLHKENRASDTEREKEGTGLITHRESVLGSEANNSPYLKSTINLRFGSGSTIDGDAFCSMPAKSHSLHLKINVAFRYFGMPGGGGR